MDNHVVSSASASTPHSIYNFDNNGDVDFDGFAHFDSAADYTAASLISSPDEYHFNGASTFTHRILPATTHHDFTAPLEMPYHLRQITLTMPDTSSEAATSTYASDVATPSDSSSSASSPLPRSPASPVSDEWNVTAEAVSSASRRGQSVSVDAKRLKHRNIDATRRQKEIAAIARLQEVCFADEKAVSRARAQSKSNKAKVDRVSTLTAAIDKIDELQRVIEQLKSKNEPESERESAGLGRKRHRTEVAAHRTVTNALIDNAFIGALMFNSSLGQLIIEADTGLCKFVNRVYSECTGWSYEEVINKPICPPLHRMSSDTADRFAAEHCATTPYVTYPNGQRRKLPKPQQLPATEIQMMQLYTQATDHVNTVIRQYHRSGDILQIHLTVFSVTVEGKRYLHFTAQKCNVEYVS